jgi:hypothetical protein
VNGISERELNVPEFVGTLGIVTRDELKANISGPAMTIEAPAVYSCACMESAPQMGFSSKAQAVMADAGTGGELVIQYSVSGCWNVWPRNDCG